jgi:hypothetical protein
MSSHLPKGAELTGQWMHVGAKSTLGTRLHKAKPRLANLLEGFSFRSRSTQQEDHVDKSNTHGIKSRNYSAHEELRN